MPYWLKNDKHGVMPVYELSEVERHKKFGWDLINYGPAPERGKPVVEPVAAPVAAPVVSQPVEAPVRRKPGRPPKAK